MACRDSRRSKSRLFLFVSSIVLGIAALVAIYSFNDNLKRDIDRQAAGLLGADLVLSTNKQPDAKTEAYLRTLGDERSSEKRFVSMALFTKTKGSRLVQVKATQGKFPFYGEIKTEPGRAYEKLAQGGNALVDRTLMLHFGAREGDSVSLGQKTFVICGILDSAPGQTGFSSAIAPVIYIPMSDLQETGLLQKGSRINYNYYYKFLDPDHLVKELTSIRRTADRLLLDLETIESTKEDTGNSFRNMAKFMSLVAFIALLLGCIGVASAVHIYVKEKIASISILRCLGASASDTILIYLIQIAVAGFAGSVLGSALGVFIQQFLPLALKEFLPLEITASLSLSSILQGIVAGLIVSIIFSLIPLLSIRKVAPLNALRASVKPPAQGRDPYRWLVYLIIAMFLVGFSYIQTREVRQAVAFAAGTGAAFLALAGMAVLLIRSVRRYFPSNWNYLLRQGFSNLFRPQNQTLTLIVCIGLGTALINTLMFVQDILIDKVTSSSGQSNPNMVLFDIQTAQKEDVVRLTRGHDLPVLQQVPIVTMRIEDIRDITAAQARKDTTLGVRLRTFYSEIRSTFRDTLTRTEKIVGGTWRGKVEEDGQVYVSLEKRYADRMGVSIGDKMTFNVQGALIPVIVGSFREVDWNNIQTNFRVVFPSGVLESAPQFHVLMTRIDNQQRAAAFQQAVVRNFPNISIIDLKLVLNVLNEITTKLGFVIRFMAGFSSITGLVVLVSSVVISKYQRRRENVLLRTLGASSRQVLIITGLEYALLGFFAALAGILLSFVAGWALARYSFQTTFIPQLTPSLLLLGVVCIATMLIGLLNSRSSLNHPPLEVLRKEV